MSNALEDILILTKTYPSPSTKYRETTCVAAFNADGQLLRIFPVPFRLLEGDQHFSKWEWIRARLARATGDRRPESRRIDVDSIDKSGRSIGTDRGWAERRRWIEPHIVAGMAALDARRLNTGQTLGFIRPTQLVSLDITEVKEPDWTDEEWAKLQRDGLFDSDEVRGRPPLKKLPFDFHYNYECLGIAGIETNRHKLTDWEVGALFWNCWRSHGPADWAVPFRQKLEMEFAAEDLLFLMGTVHRFPDQWLIVGLVYPPKPQPGEGQQLSLTLNP